VTEIVASAPLTTYESYEALQRMMESGWIEFCGRREPGKPAPTEAPPARPAGLMAREIAALVIGVVLIAAPLVGARFAPRPVPVAAEDDVFVLAKIRDVRSILELYRREHGVYPERLAQLVDDHWLDPASLTLPHQRLGYQRLAAGADYRIRLEPSR
jgi:hypothetical protein